MHPFFKALTCLLLIALIALGAYIAVLHVRGEGFRAPAAAAQIQEAAEEAAEAVKETAEEAAAAVENAAEAAEETAEEEAGAETEAAGTAEAAADSLQKE